MKEEVGLIDFNWRVLFILLLGTAVGVMLAIDRPDGQELLGLFSGTAVGALLVYGCQNWPKIGQLPLFTKGCIYSLLRLLA